VTKVCITLVNDTSSKDIVFDVNETSIANKWAGEISNDYPIFEDWRFTGWPDGPRAEYYEQEIDKCIAVVNNYAPNTITKTAASDLNYLHKFFEMLRGGVIDPNPWYENAPANVKEAVSNFNVLIHNYEKLKLSKHLSPTITCTFKGNRYYLEQEDYQHFTYDWKFGTIYINYCEVGKHLLEVFVDNDDVVGEHNIRPLKYYSADFKLKFFTDRPRSEFEEFDKRFRLWCDEHSKFFRRLGITELALGLIPVAILNYELSGFTNLTQEEIINLLSVYKRVSSVKILI
jgi:hypothetical protein